MEILANRSRCEPGAYPLELRKHLSISAAASALDEITSWDGYAPTPLIALPQLATAAGVRAIMYKDEGGRFGLGSFKALGAGYAVERLARRCADRSGVTVCCATDGNHGRALAWKAAELGLRCIVYLHADVSPQRELAIRRFGAEIVRTPGNYDDAVAIAARDAAANGWTVVSDTSYEGYTQIPCAVMQGYSVIAQEVIDAGFHPTHLFVQGGVGGLAAALCAHFWEHWGSRRPRIIVVEPENAACLLASVQEGKPTRVEGRLQTVMAGLACGEVSAIAWEILSRGAHHFVTVTDEEALTAMRLLASGDLGVPPIIAGESATAGLAAFLACSRDPETRVSLALDENAKILLIGTEADTDPELFHRIIGQSAEELLRAPN